MTTAKFINVSNCFRTERFNVLCEELEKGEKVHIYVDCIGHTRRAMTEEEYEENLQKKYGERLCKEGKYSSDTAYFLK